MPREGQQGILLHAQGGLPKAYASPSSARGRPRSIASLMMQDAQQQGGHYSWSQPRTTTQHVCVYRPPLLTCGVSPSELFRAVAPATAARRAASRTQAARIMTRRAGASSSSIGRGVAKLAWHGRQRGARGPAPPRARRARPRAAPRARRGPRPPRTYMHAFWYS
jgi:hypothetical protein